MRVLILGFSSLQEIDSVMEKLIAESGCFLFTVICGGKDNAAYNHAISRGAPVSFSQAKTPQGYKKGTFRSYMLQLGYILKYVFGRSI